ncbi:MAG TPA: hypothetical protein VGR69_00205 [Candidatus Rubrimentiphilum sp.]|nr:hypothetical protein [Candidatus Rubrimentiphilum sp.]
MRKRRFIVAAVVLFALAAPNFAIAATQYITITVTNSEKKPIYNAAVHITDRQAMPPEKYTGSTKNDGTYRFAIWPNANGEICFQAQLRTSPHSKSKEECFRAPYPASIDLEISGITRRR